MLDEVSKVWEVFVYFSVKRDLYHFLKSLLLSFMIDPEVCDRTREGSQYLDYADYGIGFSSFDINLLMIMSGTKVTAVLSSMMGGLIRLDWRLVGAAIHCKPPGGFVWIST